jgi:hypothetical protein
MMHFTAMQHIIFCILRIPCMYTTSRACSRAYLMVEADLVIGTCTCSRELVLAVAIEDPSQDSEQTEEMLTGKSFHEVDPVTLICFIISSLC